MDSEPPAIVWEGREACANSDRSESLLRRGLSSSTAPGQMWVVNVHLETTARRVVTAESEITDNDGMTVAHRSLSGADCDGLARATSVWASLVLDSEMTRARVAEEKAAATPPFDPDATSSAPWPPWPAPAAPPEVTPEHDWYLHHNEERTLEAGLAGFLMTGPGGTAIGGFAPFVVVEASHGIFLRPSVVVGESMASLSSSREARADIATGRFDTCVRMPGLYTQHRGMQLDACAGAELGAMLIDGSPTVPFLATGPSLELRGELGSALSATLRGLAGVTLLREGYVDPSGSYVDLVGWTGRVELAISWGLR